MKNKMIISVSDENKIPHNIFNKAKIIIFNEKLSAISNNNLFVFICPFSIQNFIKIYQIYQNFMSLHISYSVSGSGSENNNHAKTKIVKIFTYQITCSYII